MTRTCLYGTVYNNVMFVEESVRSVWRPDTEIVIVDSYSTDGTWEKLSELRKDYNLKLYRYKCTRGLGRHIALYKCPENSTTAYFDLDTIYNEAFHKVVDYGVSTGLRVAAQTFVARREAIISKGGWRDLNYGEDVELVSRVGFDVAIPVIIGRNACIPAFISTRERRYGGLRRVVKSSIDLLRGHGTSIDRLLITRSRRGLLFYVPARLIGFYRNRKPDNATWIELAALSKCIKPRDAGISDEYFTFMATHMLLKKVKHGEKTIDTFVSQLVTRPVYKLYLRTRNLKIIYFKDYRWLDKSILPLAESVRSLELQKP